MRRKEPAALLIAATMYIRVRNSFTCLHTPQLGNIERHAEGLRQVLLSLQRPTITLTLFYPLLLTCEPLRYESEAIEILYHFLNCCFTVHFDKFKAFLPTNALFIKT
jgi:hypothetical protein